MTNLLIPPSSPQQQFLDQQNARVQDALGPSAAGAEPDEAATPTLSPKLQKLFEDAATKYEVPVNVLMAVAERGSGYDPYSRGPGRGIMGLADDDWRQEGINPYMPAQAVDYAARKMRGLLDQQLDMPTAVRAFSGGRDIARWDQSVNEFGSDVLQRAQRIGDTLYPAPPKPVAAFDVDGAGNRIDAAPPAEPPAGEYESRTWAQRHVTDRLKSGGLGVLAGASGGIAQSGGAQLAAIERIDRGEAVDEADDPMGYQHMSSEQRQQAKSEVVGRLATAAGNTADLSAQQQAIPKHPAVAAALEAKSFGEFWENFKKAPLTFVASVGMESLPAMAPALAAGVPAGIAAGPAGFALGMGAGSYAVDYQSAVLEALGEMGVDVTDRAALEGAFGNPETMEHVRRLANSHASVVGAADAASGGVAGRALVRGAGAAARAANMGAQMGAGAALGMAGEAGGQIAQGKTDLGVGQILAEGLGEMSMAPVEVAGAALSRGRQVAAPQTSEQSNAAVEQSPPPATPEPMDPVAAVATDAAGAERLMGAEQQTPPEVAAGGDVGPATDAAAPGVDAQPLPGPTGASASGAAEDTAPQPVASAGVAVGPARVIVEGDADVPYGAIILDEDDTGVWLLTEDGRRVVVDKEDVANGAVRVLPEAVSSSADSVVSPATGATSAQVDIPMPAPSEGAAPAIDPEGAAPPEALAQRAGAGATVIGASQDPAPALKAVAPASADAMAVATEQRPAPGGIDPETGEVLSTPASGDVAARAVDAVVQRGRPSQARAAGPGELDSLTVDELRRRAKVLTDNGRRQGWDARSVAARNELLSAIAARNADVASRPATPVEQAREDNEAGVAPDLRVRSDSETGAVPAAEDRAGAAAGRESDAGSAGAGVPSAAADVMARREDVPGAVVASQPEAALTGLGEVTSPPAKIGLRGKGKLASTARRASDLIGGAVAGDAITLSHDVEYATAGQEFRVERIDGKGTVHVIGPSGAGTSLSLGALTGAKKRGVTVARVPSSANVSDGPGETSGAAGQGEQAPGNPLSARSVAGDYVAAEQIEQDSRQARIANVPPASAATQTPDATGPSQIASSEQGAQTAPQRNAAARALRQRAVTELNAMADQAERDGRGGATPQWQGAMLDAKAAAGFTRGSSPPDFSVGWQEGLNNDSPPISASRARKAGAGAGRRWAAENNWRGSAPTDTVSYTLPRADESKAGTRMEIANDPEAIRGVAKRVGKLPPDRFFSAAPAQGPFGPIFEGLTNKPEDAIRKLMEEKRGEVPDAFVHPDLGPIAFVYGNNQFGLMHIESKHGQSVLMRMPGVLRDGRVLADRGGLPRAYIVTADDPARVAVVRLDWDGEEKAWLVTAFDDEQGSIVARQVRTSNVPPASASTRIPDATERSNDSIAAAGREYAGGEKTSNTPASSDRVPSKAGVVFSDRPGTKDNNTSKIAKRELGRERSRGAIHRALVAGRYGRIIHKLIEGGQVVLHKDESTLPKGRAGEVLPPGIIQGMAAGGKVHLVASNLTPETALPVLLHEMFHAGRGVMTGARWNNLMSRVGRALHAAEDRRAAGDKGDANQAFWDAALKRVDAAETPLVARAEELAAYAIEHRAQAPKGILSAVDGLIGAVKDYLARRFGIQAGKVTPAQLQAMAVAALRSYGRPLSGIPESSREALYSMALKGPSTPQGKRVMGGVDRMLSDTLTKAVPGLAKAAPLRILVETNKRINGLTDYLRHRDALEVHRMRWADRAHDALQPWLKYASKNSGANARLMDFMHETTLAQVDPSKGFSPLMTKVDQQILEIGRPGTEAYDAALEKKRADERRRADHDRFRAEWETMAPEARQIYEAVRDRYQEMADERDGILIDNMRKSMEIALKRAEKAHTKALLDIDNQGLAGQARQDAVKEADEKLKKARRDHARNRATRLTRMRVMFEQNRLSGPYFRLARFGKYFVHARNAEGETVSFSRFEHLKDAKAEVSRLGANGYEVKQGVMAESQQAAKDVSPQFVADIEEMLGAAGVDRSLLDDIWQRYLETFPDMSTRTSQIHRKGTAGYTGDAVRAYSDHMFHGAYQNARLKYVIDLQEALNDAEEFARSEKDSTRSMSIVNEMRVRHQFMMNPTNAAWVQGLSAAAYFMYLGFSFSNAAMNLFQIPQFGMPILAAYHGTWRGGYTAAATEFLRASRDFMSMTTYDTKTRQLSVAGSPRLTEDERAAMDEIYKTPLVERTQSLDLSGVAEQGIGAVDGRRIMGVIPAMKPQTVEKLKRMSSYMSHQTERFNREITALAAYRMARKKGEAHQQAIEAAIDLTYQIHFDYSNSARPSLMQGDLAKAVLVFQNYTANALGRAAVDLHQSMAGDSAQSRKEARIRFFGAGAMMFATAGLPGLWFAKQLLWLGGMFFGGDDDDIEGDLKKVLADVFGETAAAGVWRGVPGAVLGLDVGSRIGMGEPLVRVPDRSLEGSDEILHWVSAGLGAGFSATAIKGFRTLNHLRQGEYWRAGEAAAPKFLADPMRNIRFAREGALTRKGEPIKEKFSMAELAGGALGFQSLDLVKQYDLNTALKNRESAIADRRKEAVDRWANAVKQGDGLAEARDRINEFNRANPDWRITRDGLRQSLRARKRASARTEGGIALNPKVAPRLRRESPPRI